MEIRPGLTFGRYTIEAELGRGGMGVVALANDGILERKVALKLLLPGLLTREEIVARFFGEAKITAQLTHANTVRIYDLGEADGIPFIVMEYIDGKPLTAYLGDRSIPADVRMRWLVDVARGLAAAHARGLLHRDVKPANVMVGSDGTAKVLDFGLAKREETTPEVRATFQTAAGFVIGTPAYMAPEQLEGLEVDARTDQFGWALTTYALLLGKNLRKDDPLLFGPIPLLSDKVGIPRRAAEIVLRALSHDREMRFPSMEALLAELEPALSALPTGQYPRADLPPDSVAPETRKLEAPERLTLPMVAPHFCPECGVAFALSSPQCTRTHAEGFPLPPGHE